MPGLLNKIKHKIDPTVSSHPLAIQRDEFLAVKPEAPVEKKAHFTHEVVGAAAAFEALKAYRHHQSENGGGRPTHARGKEMVAGLSAGYVVKLIEEKGLPFTSEKDKKKFQANATKSAHKDALRGLRDSGMYQAHELDPITDDEKHGHQL